MNPGKNRCEYLKEVRRRIATVNEIPLEQRECTFKGECSGTCPFCEAELQYLEKELHKRRTLGKAVTVAGIALSSLAFGACETSSNYVPSSGTTGYSPPVFSTAADSTDPSALRAEYERCFTQVRGNRSDGTGSHYIVDGVKVRTATSYTAFNYDVAAKFPKEYGSPVLWLSQRLHDFHTYMTEELLDDAMVTFVVNPDGVVSDVDFAYMPTVSEQDFAFQNEVRKQVLMMPRWEPATKNDTPVSYPVAIAVSDLR